jgi:hypothetical protein
MTVPGSAPDWQDLYAEGAVARQQMEDAQMRYDADPWGPGSAFGIYEFCGVPVEHLDDDALAGRRNRKIGFVLESFRLFHVLAL